MISETKQPPTKTAVPVQPQERIDFVDILRGFALLGVFMFNMWGFAGASFGLMVWPHGWDRALVVARDFLIQAKFYSLFSFLFGWGMSIHMLRAQQRGMKFLPVYLRRLLILLLLGLAHGILIWDGDILTYYALMGFLLVLFRNRSERFLLITAVTLLLFSIFMTLPYTGVTAVRNWYGELTAFAQQGGGPPVYATATWVEIVRQRAPSFIGGNVGNFIYVFGNILSMFLLGLYAGKRQIFQNVAQHRPFLRRVMWGGLLIGILLNGLFVLNIYWRETGLPDWYPANFLRTIHTGTRTFGAPALMLFYVSGLTLLTQRESWRERLAPLGPVGRMALTNYLTQSMLGTLIFYGYGLGLYGRTTPLFGVILVIVIFLAQIRFSAWWLARYQFGPMEWLWRSLTYGRKQPLRRGETLAEVRPFTWKQRAGFVLVVSLLVGGYGWRNWRPDGAVGENLPFISSAEVKVTPTPIVPELTPTPTVEPTAAPAIVPPPVQPVAFNPDVIVANGDWAALVDSFDVDAALDTITILSGDQFNGRAAGTAGGYAAGDTIAGQFARLGLQPAGTDSYFQSFPIRQTVLADVPHLVVETADGVIDDYVLFQDFAPAVRMYMGAGTAEGQVVWANNCAREDFAGLETVGKVVLCRGDWPRTEVSRTVLEHGAAALLLLAGPDSPALDFTPVYYDTWLPDTLSLPTFRVSEAVAADLLAGSAMSVSDLSITFTSFPLETAVHLEVAAAGPNLCPDGACTGRNVLGVLPGRDPAYADEVVIISAHYDHLGTTPDGMTWPGANDNASGVAAMLELARTWQEAGFVPRRTVLFAAWDAEEIGLLGSRHYVGQPQYPLEKTVGVINLDMVGGGEATLYLSGAGLEDQTVALAATMGITATVRESGRSDHYPFQQGGIPAGTLGWFSGTDGVPSYHRSTDTPAVIETQKLAAVGRIAGLMVLNLADAGPQIDEMLARRAAAIGQNDVDGFLATSYPDRRSGDRIWLADVAALSPISATLTADHLRLLGNTAVADTHLNLIYRETVDGNPITRTMKVSLPTRFESSADGWQWAGADLVTAERGEDEIFTISYPANISEIPNFRDVGLAISQQYTNTSNLLGLPVNPAARLLLYPTADALRADTAVTLPASTTSWIGPDTIKLVYSEPITGHPQLTTGLTQLLLAQAGVAEADAPWLWHGLAPAIAAESDFAAVQRANLPVLQAAFAEEEFVSGEATDWAAAAGWAAVDYLQRQIGWEGLGRFILDVGEQGVAAALATAVNQTPAQFEAAWQQDWQSQLAGVETAVNNLLTARTEAILSQNRTAFLNTVDETIPYLQAEEDHWFDDLMQYLPLNLSWTGAPLVVYGDGRILANVTLTYELSNLTGRRKGGSVRQEILLTPTETGLRWAGVPLETLPGEQVVILYPQDQSELAQKLLNYADALTTRLPDYRATGLPDNTTTQLTLKLYPDDGSFRISIYPSLALADNVAGWAGPNESIKLRPNVLFTGDEYRSALAMLLARQQVAQLGVTDEWLLQGVSYYLAAQLDPENRKIAAEGLHNLWLGVANNRIKSVTEIPERLALGDESTQKLAIAHAWDSVRYLVQTHGEAALLDVLRAQGRGQTLDAALQSAIGQSLAEFEAAWIESLRQAHAQPEWLDVANGFDATLAEEHLAVLAAPELAGRQAGSPGAAAAADYIAEQFAAYGLEPVVDLPPVIESATITETIVITGTAAITGTTAVTSSMPITGTDLLTVTPALSGVEVAVSPPELSYFQPFTIEYAALTAVPQLTIGDETFEYRRDFLTLLDELPGGGLAQGELVFIADGAYPGLDVSGKIVIRAAGTAVHEEMIAAMAHGAAGLILVGESDYEKGFQMKRPLPANFPDDPMIPTLLLTQIGLEHLLGVTGMTRADLNNLPLALPLGMPVTMDIPLSQPEVVADVASATANVLGLLPGSDPDLRDEVIIISAHYDHVGDDPGGLAYSGANDNASGVAVMLAMAKLWQETGYRPARSILFAAWGAQEPGQIGSTAFISSTLFVPAQTAGVVVLDAVGGGAGFRLLAQGNWEQDGLLIFGMEQAGEVLDGRVRTGIPADQSDDVTFRASGVPTILLTWTDASEDNWPDAIADEINPNFLAATGRMTTLAVMSVAR